MRSIKLGNMFSTLSTITALLALLSLSGCSRFLIDNEPPEARAQLLAMDGTPITDFREPIPFMGTPLVFTLDSSMSTDDDGTIVKYEWLDTSVPANVRYDAGIMDLASFKGDPLGASPQVTLSEGHYKFSLWVTDDEDAISAPATLEFTIESPPMWMPDAMCKTMYMSDIPECADCVCTPTVMMGCYDNYAACYLNPDPMFVTLCKAIVDCAREKMCTGSACFTPDLCQAEITAGVQYMGGTDCMGVPAVNPCSAASQLGTCTSMGACVNACRP